MRSQQKLIVGPIEGYKIVNEDMTCRDFKFEVGKRIKLPNNDDIELCKNGFHFCKYPSGVWAYYSSGRVFKVRAYGVLDSSPASGADFKLVCEEIELYEEVKIGGDRNTGNYNTGNYNTGDYNTGYRNTGDYNAGYRNTGYRNTGNYNTGYGNCGNYHSGSLNIGEAQIYLFNKITKLKRDEIDWSLVNRLAQLLSQEADIDPTPFLSIPNATAKGIKKLHEAHKAARRG